jgi:CDP-6-deoxy-D-xylo-4-hexulose-3-dehydrase
MSRWPLMKETITLSDRLKLAKFALTTRQFTNGPKVKEFESKWNEWLGSKYSLFVSSGSTANYLLLAAVKELYGLKNGDKVLVPSCTWMTNVAPVIQLGFEPIFCDINLYNFSFDLDNLEYIAEKHPDIKLIFVTHLLGFSAENEKYQKLFPEALILDDVCESHGCTSENGIKRGANSLGATFSFYFGHHMTTVEGGMISTNNSQLYDLMKLKRSHGLARESVNFENYAKENPEIQKSFLFVTDGYNFRNHEMCAVLGLSQLKRLSGMVEVRNKNYYSYTQLLENFPHLFEQVPYFPTSSNFCFPFICKSKKIYNSLINTFQKFGIEYRPVVSGNLLKQPFLKGNMLTSKTKNTNIDKVHYFGVYIGNNHFVTKHDIDFLFELILNLDNLLKKDNDRI